MHHRLAIWSAETTWCITTMVLVTSSMKDHEVARVHIHEMVDLCISGSVVCIITRNTCIMDARCCIGVVQYIGAYAVPRYTQ